MDGLGLYVLFNISVISGRWEGEYEGPCAMKHRLGKGLFWSTDITQDINIPDSILLSLFISSNYKYTIAHAHLQINEGLDGVYRLMALFEPCHAIMALFVLRKLILQTRMRSHPEGLDAWYLVRPFVYFYTLCVRTAKALASA